MKEKTGFFEVSPGNFSIMRLVFLILIINAILMGWYSIIVIDVGAAVAIFGTISSVATSLKIIQKHQENAKML